MAAPVLQLRKGTTTPGSIFYAAEPVYNTTGKILYLGDAGGTGTGAGAAVASASTYAAAAEILVKSAASTSAGQIKLLDAQATQNTLTFRAPATVTSSYNFTLPAAVPAAASGYFMTSDTSGNTSWSQIGVSAVTGLGTGVSVFLGTPSSANLAAAVTDETGTGALVFGTSPSLTTPSLAGETFSTTNNVTAGTNAQGQGALTTDINVITTAAAAPSGVTLPTATTGRRMLIVNKGANAVNVFPATGATIDALAVNTAISIPVNGLLEFSASSTTQWYSSFNSSVTGTGVTTFSAGTTGLTPNSATSGAITLGGTLAVANGGTGVTTSTGSGSNVLSTSPTITTSLVAGGATFDLLNTTATTVNFVGAATTLTVGNTATAAQAVDMFTASTGASTYNFATGATANATTKTINIGTNGVAGSTTNINIGGSAGTSTTSVNGNLTVGGNLTINGTTTTLNTQSILVEDRFIELGLVNGTAPSSSTTWDSAIGFNYFATTAKKSALVWLDNTGFALASELAIASGDTGTTAADPQLTVTTHAALAIGSLFIGALGVGTNEVITSAKSVVNVTIDCGTYP